MALRLFERTLASVKPDLQLLAALTFWPYPGAPRWNWRRAR
jgi:hypothetical protein